MRVPALSIYVYWDYGVDRETHPIVIVVVSFETIISANRFRGVSDL